MYIYILYLSSNRSQETTNENIHTSHCCIMTNRQQVVQPIRLQHLKQYTNKFLLNCCLIYCCNIIAVVRICRHRNCRLHRSFQHLGPCCLCLYYSISGSLITFSCFAQTLHQIKFTIIHPDLVHYMYISCTILLVQCTCRIPSPSPWNF